MQSQLLKKVNTLVREWHALPPAVQEELMLILTDDELSLLCSSAEFEPFCSNAYLRRQTAPLPSWLTQSMAEKSKQSDSDRYERLRNHALLRLNTFN